MCRRLNNRAFTAFHQRMEHHEDIRTGILKLCSQRGPGKSVCPSEVARNLFPSNWRSHMEEVRATARRLAAQGTIQITQGPNVLNPSQPIRGPIRLRLSKK